MTATDVGGVTGLLELQRAACTAVLIRASDPLLSMKYAYQWCSFPTPDMIAAIHDVEGFTESQLRERISYLTGRIVALNE